MSRDSFPAQHQGLTVVVGWDTRWRAHVRTSQILLVSQPQHLPP